MNKNSTLEYIKFLDRSFLSRFSGSNSVVLGLSGGVDSSVCLYLAHELGLKVRPVYINVSENPDACRSTQDYLDALHVASKFNLKLELVDYSVEYRKEVYDKVLEGYERGEVPNPDILCNSAVKFKAFSGVDCGSAIVTGHYAWLSGCNVSDSGNVCHSSSEIKSSILTPLDTSKDQSYFLSSLIGEPLILEKLFFPLGGLHKNDVREIAKMVDLPNYNKPDSQGVCMVGSSTMLDFLKSSIAVTPGKVFNLLGNEIGRHYGSVFYVVGQRHGFEITKYQGRPLYVVQKNIKDNILIVGDKGDCYKRSLKFKNLVLGGTKSNFSDFISGKQKVYARIRNLGSMVEVGEVMFDEATGTFLVKFEEPVFGVNSGQEIVFYEYVSDCGDLGYSPMQITGVGRIV